MEGYDRDLTPLIRGLKWRVAFSNVLAFLWFVAVVAFAFYAAGR